LARKFIVLPSRRAATVILAGGKPIGFF